MLKSIFLSGAIFLSVLCTAQEYKKIDEITRGFYYDYSFLQDSTNLSSVKHQEMVLQIGKHSSKFISTNIQYTDSLLYTVRNIKGGFFKYVWPKVSKLKVHRFCEYVIYKNYPSKNNVQFIGTLGAKSVLCVDEKLNFDWSLINDQDTTIMGYKCQKATCYFAGRKYNAWYTTKIPISEGPYKFHGLPGLIVRIADTNKEHTFQLYKVKNYNKTFQMLYVDQEKTRPTSAPDFAKAMKAYIAEMYTKYGGNSNIQYLEADGESKTLRNIRSWNNYIEKY